MQITLLDFGHTDNQLYTGYKVKVMLDNDKPLSVSADLFIWLLKLSSPLNIRKGNVKNFYPYFEKKRTEFFKTPDADAFAIKGIQRAYLGKKAKIIVYNPIGQKRGVTGVGVELIVEGKKYPAEIMPGILFLLFNEYSVELNKENLKGWFMQNGHAPYVKLKDDNKLLKEIGSQIPMSASWLDVF